ncbi:MAG TPA: 16S rRNA (guanine(966)-N(2))-methyltransferase RsmD [bacterium]|jgi:16S rRNA (guanine(966)-N(2))-methyltransferase RsmD|nr:16S rRNA (guanine(966)-N(2))-methyltransferase RsmD [bacterium]
MARRGVRGQSGRRSAGIPRVRPTQSRVRDALFNSLGPRVQGARILDLFAGSGALGLAALARGAAEVVFVERDARLIEGIRGVLAKEGWAERAEVWRREAVAVVRELGTRRRVFDLILMDPPYGEGWIPRMLRAIRAAGVQAPGGLIAAEGHWRDRPEAAPGFVRRREARYGETALWFYEAESGGEHA